MMFALNHCRWLISHINAFNQQSQDYKIPTAADVPSDIRVSFLKGKPNEDGIFSSRGEGNIYISIAIFTLTFE